MLTITPDDFSRLSISCQRELMGLLGFNVDLDYVDSGESMPYEFAPEQISGEEYYQSTIESSEATSSAKQVIDITMSDAKDLIANISKKSIETLRRFTTGEHVNVDELIGDGRPYSNLSDLKRSFVGAVNRRLRTVTGNRRAVLFLTVSTEGSKFGARIAVRPQTAAALNKAMQVNSIEPC